MAERNDDAHFYDQSQKNTIPINEPPPEYTPKELYNSEMSNPTVPAPQYLPGSKLENQPVSMSAEEAELTHRRSYLNNSFSAARSSTFRPNQTGVTGTSSLPSAGPTRDAEPMYDPHWSNDQYQNQQWDQYYYEEDQAAEQDVQKRKSKKKSLIKKLSKFVGPFAGKRTIGRISEMAASPNYGTDQDQTEDYRPALPVPLPLSIEEIGFYNRYSNPSAMQLIRLQDKPATQPIDIQILNESNLIFICDVGRSIVEIFDFDGTLQHVIDNTIMKNFYPTALAVAFDGTIVISSFFTHSLLMYLKLESFQDPTETVPQLNFVYKQFQLGSQGHQIHQFNNPAGLTLDKETSYLYICDRGNLRIKVLTPRGVCERTIQLWLNTGKKLQLEPISIALQPKSGQLVCIIAGSAICFLPKTASDDIEVEPWTVVDGKGLALENASAIATDGNDRIFIADTGNHRIVICTADGAFVTSFATQGNGLGQLNRPCGIDVSNDGTIFVTDSGNKRIHIFGLIPRPAEPPEEPALPSISTENPAPINPGVVDDQESLNL